MGARPLRRAIQRYIEDGLADFVLQSALPEEGGTVVVDRAPEGLRRTAEDVLQQLPRPGERRRRQRAAVGDLENA